VQVLEDRSNPNGRKLDLHVVVLSATSSVKGEPIIYFEGGPGGSAITNFGQTFYTAFRPLREKHDIVLIDQRGTGKSSSLQCTEITEREMQDLSENLNNDDAIGIFTEGFEACLTRLSKTTDPAFYTSTILADDTDEVRQALGYDKVNVYGSSYGTWLAQIYLGRHGENVKAMILDSVAGPWNFYILDAAQNAQKSLERVFALCEADTACNELYPNLSDQMDKALEQLDKKPAKTSGLSGMSGKSYPVVMTRSRFLEALRSMLYTGAISE
jgi:pimeloyl-ACP methyl ester carboxylesterase